MLCSRTCHPPPTHLVQLLCSDGLKEVAVVVDEPHTCVVGMQRVALLSLYALAQLQGGPVVGGATAVLNKSHSSGVWQTCMSAAVQVMHIHQLPCSLLPITPTPTRPDQPHLMLAYTCTEVISSPAHLQTLQHPTPPPPV
jgi:hypothetical protein